MQEIDSVEIKLNVSSANDESSLEEFLAVSNEIGYTMDLTVSQIIDNAEITTLSELNDLLAITVDLPVEIQNMEDYRVYRHHEGLIDILTTTPNNSGEYITLNTTKTAITIYASKFSTYAIASTQIAPIFYVTITLDANGGINTTDAVTVVSGTTFAEANIADPIYDGYTFVEWQYSDYTVVADTDIFEVDTIITALWEEIIIPAEIVKITFNANGGTTNISSVYVIAGDTLANSYYIVDGDTAVYLTSLPTATRSGYTFNGWYSNGYAVGFDTITFDVDTTVTASWTKKSSNSSSNNSTTESTEVEDTTVVYFNDVDSDAYYADAIAWAVENGITNGVSDTSFGIGKSGTREQVMTFLWRLAGMPTSDYENIFTDLVPSEYYYNAILWAIENGITNGMSDDLFGTGNACTRAQIVTFLWRYAGEPTADSSADFADVDGDVFYANAVAWAVENGITNGYNDDTFAPDDNCTREQIVTFLYRFASTL